MTNKLLLAAIAAGLWANAIATTIRPAHAADTDPVLSKMEVHLAAIAASMHTLLTGGKDCQNSKICD
jgi:predicted secreted protein